MSSSGVSVHRLLRAAVDFGRKPQRSAPERGLLRRREERGGGPLRRGRVRHILQSVFKGIPNGGHDQWTMHLRLGNYKGYRWEYFSVQGRPEDRTEPEQRRGEDCHSLPVRLAGKWIIVSLCGGGDFCE